MRRLTMKSIITPITLTAALAISLLALRSGAQNRATSIIPIVQAQRNGGCSEATLNGSYGLLLNGTIFGRGLLGGAGVLTFDGEGNDTYAATLVTEDMGVQHVTSVGNYQVNPDCAGSRVNGAATFDFVIVDGGKEVLQIATRADRVVT